jgi:cytochrome c oxidase subunit 3
MVLGLVFVVGQYLAWLKLRSQGLYLPTNPNSSFFYVFTGVHAVHVVGGLGGLSRVMVKFRRAARPLRRSTIDATSYYWHFMGLLWMYLLFVLWAKL